MNIKEHQFTAGGFVGDYGLMVERLTIAGPAAGRLNAADIRLENNYRDLSGRIPSGGVREVVNKDGESIVTVESFRYDYDFKVSIVNPAAGLSLSFGKADLAEMAVKDLDDFTAYETDGVFYRLHEPEADRPRPLILFLHGGGECGTDNWAQMTGTVGALQLGKRYPDMYVCAPQAPDCGMSMEEAFRYLASLGDPFKVEAGMPPFSTKGVRGWNRDYLMKICGIIRRLVAAGKVDRRRIYICGMSMGGGGVLTALSVDAALFAAAVPICPSMNGETYAALEFLPPVPTWVCAAYIDHSRSRHAYILAAMQNLWQMGRTDVRFTIFNETELARYGIGTTPGLTEAERLAENHHVWILPLRNEKSILDWMVSQRCKENC